MAQVRGSGRVTEPVYVVTDARRAHSEEVANRTRHYLISMGIRTVCLILAIFVLSGAVRWVAVGAAVVLPWIAVIIANATPVSDETGLTPVGPGQAQEIEGAPRAAADAPASSDAPDGQDGSPRDDSPRG